MQPSSFSRPALTQLVIDLICGELMISRGRDPRDAGPIGQGSRLDERGLDLDSLERLDASAAVNEYFHLHEHGTEDRLLALRTLSEWVDLVEDALPHTSGRVTFRTSGSTGAPKRCTHRVADLLVEARDWNTALAPASIVSLVPMHHIYGTMFTALLADVAAVVPADRRWSVAALAQAEPGALVVGTPTQWARAARLVPRFPAGVTGVTSTAPLAPGTADALRALGLDRLIEIYGSSETGGIGWREAGTGAYTLLPHLRRTPDGMARRRADEGWEPTVPLDAVEWHDDRHFTLGTRVDAVVQVGGNNVDPRQVADVLCDHAEVGEADVRFDPASGRLKAFVVPVVDVVDEVAFTAALDSWCRERLTTAQRPRRFTLGRALPTSAMGKRADW